MEHFTRIFFIAERKRNIQLEKFKDRIIFMSMFNDIDWTRKGNDGICISSSAKVKEYAKRFSQRHWTFLGPGDEKRCYGTFSYTPEGKWDSCEGCDIVQSDHAPQAGVAQGIFNGELVRRRVGHQVELEEEQDEEVGRRVRRDAQRTTHRCACMDDME